MWDAVALFCMLLAALVLLEPWLLTRLAEPAWTGWLVQHALLPLARSACVLTFIVLAYPDIYGLDRGAPLAEALDNGRWADLLNLGFLVSLCLPLLPAMERVPGIILPLQGFLILAILFRWAVEPANPISLWPSTAAWMAVALAGLAPLLAEWLAPTQQPGHDKRRDAVLIPLQLPPLLLYGHALGAQLA